jgi:hypothetical protein
LLDIGYSILRLVGRNRFGSDIFFFGGARRRWGSVTCRQYRARHTSSCARKPKPLTSKPPRFRHNARGQESFPARLSSQTYSLFPLIIGHSLLDIGHSVSILYGNPCLDAPPIYIIINNIVRGTRPRVPENPSPVCRNRHASPSSSSSLDHWTFLVGHWILNSSMLRQVLAGGGRRRGERDLPPISCAAHVLVCPKTQAPYVETASVPTYCARAGILSCPIVKPDIFFFFP